MNRGPCAGIAHRKRPSAASARIAAANLFWRKINADVISVTAGTLDRPTGLHVKHLIYCASRSDYDVIQDQLPNMPAGAEAG